MLTYLARRDPETTFGSSVQSRSFRGLQILNPNLQTARRSCGSSSVGRKGDILEGFRLRGASTYPMSEGSVLQSCLDPPRGSVRTSAADPRSNPPDTGCRVGPW